MKIFKFERDDEKGAIILKRDVALAVTKNLRKRFKSINSAKRYLESYGYRTVRTARNPSVRERNNPVKSRIGSSSAVDQYLKNNPSARLAKITVDMVLGKDTDLTVRGLSSFTFSFEGESPESVRKIKKFFGRKAKIEGEYDKDTDMTYIYMDIPSKKSSIKGPNECNSRSPLVRGFHNEWYVVIEKNLARRTSRMIDYDYGEENMYDNVVMKISDWAYNNNDKSLIKSLNKLKTSKDFVKRTGSKIPYGYATDIYGDKEWEILELTKENFEELGEQYPDIYDRFSEEDFE